MKSRKHWIAFAKSPKGKIMVDRGAENALIRKGKSLLPSGVIAVYGRFTMGNSVIIMNQQKRSLAVGLVNYQSADEIIHKDNLVLMDNHWEA